MPGKLLTWRPKPPPASFPHCPKCGSYYLYRKDNRGPYQCETCGRENISEEAAFAGCIGDCGDRKGSKR